MSPRSSTLLAGSRRIHLLAAAVVRRQRLGAARRRRGSAAAEFAITLPVLVLLMFGTVEYGNYFSELAQVNTCTRSGARYGGTRGSSQDLADARVQGAIATRTLLADLGYDCQVGSSSCTVQTAIVQQEAVDMLEVTVEIQYQSLTHALPSSKTIPLAPTMLKARAVYPIIGE